MFRVKGVIKMLAASVAVLAFSVPALSAPAGPVSMLVGGLTSQPIGHYDFCKKHADDCKVLSQDTVAPNVTDFGWKTLKEVNERVNSRVVPMTDMDIYGQEEVWAFPEDKGDCEDFVLEKRKELIAKGFPVSDVLITVVRKPDGEGHAVLTVRSSKGDFILDNLNNDVKLWTETPYSYLKRQASFDSGRWVTIEQTPAMLVGYLQ